MKLPSQPNRRRALTLMEVMVIVVVLVAFAVVIMVTANKGRVAWTTAARIRCVSNLKNVGFGFRIWANDNDDKFPYLSPTNYGAGTGGSNLAYRNESNAWLHFLVMSNQLGSAKTLTCPTDRERMKGFNVDFSSSSIPPNLGLQFTRNSGVSYFIGLDADMTRPQAMLAGDRHLETKAWNVQGSILTFTSNQPPSWTAALHGYAGNITLSDGSVQQMTTAALQAQARDALRSLGMETNRLLMPW